ncbi:hypothetical protein ACSBR2_026192 [Camellia fascicularis]
MAMQIAMERALNAETHTKWLGSKCRNELEKNAWSDCLKLYESTILQLNNTLDPNTKCSDAQTWLSTALTNLETCRAGFIELGVSDFMLPLMSNNVSKLISNTLAINNGSTEKQTYEEGFPTWVSPGNRKLLQSSSPAANLVVAQDGSGNYKTIQAALDVAAKRSGSGRFVIHVKSGVYQENIEIGNNMKNIMLLGDGLKNTIITGSRSVGGDFIFGNATVVLQNCMIYARKAMSGQQNTVTTQGRIDPNQNTVISIHNSQVMASSDLKPVLSSFKTYLGRPWMEYSRTVYLQTYLDTLVDPAGWLEWDGNFALNTLYYGEYKNSGPGSSTSGRVKWGGYRVISSATEASQFSVAKFIAGQSWLPSINYIIKSHLY